MRRIRKSVFRNTRSIVAIYLLIFANEAFAQSVCDDINEQQASLNRSWRQLNEDYPVTMTGFLECMRKADDISEKNGCTAAAIVMANQCPFGGCSTNADDWSGRILSLQIRWSNLSRRKIGAPWCRFDYDAMREYMTS
ncbi:hypothetical protein [Sphingomonas kyeonggiensis]|uniref:Uncharacterized protein n=1 Tax=Sphingomonas kyeonggiensis TaxID=1268553 RepID=A0A7W6JTW5_9SPHN|nr:hypothetical protein [Sphingomonas kyeonggiensis]MBB4098375.1 hypothetical protein [Sphingomonas kyeonggiensis]